MKIAKECAEYFIKGLQFYTHYNSDAWVAMIGLDIEPDYNGIFLALHHEYSLQHIELGTADWDESTLVRFDIGNGGNIKNSTDNELNENIQSIVIETIDEMISGFNNINGNSKVLFGCNLHEGAFNIIREIDSDNDFQIDEEIIQKGLENAILKDNCPEREVLTNMNIEAAPKRVLEDIEKIFYKKPNFSWFCILIKHYGTLKNSDLILKLLRFVIDNTDFSKAALWDRITLKVIEENGINDDFVVKAMESVFESTNLPHIAETIIKVTGDAPEMYFRFCPKCKSRLKTKKSLQCEKCSYKWHNCPKCGAQWVRDESKCNNCGYDLYSLF